MNVSFVDAHVLGSARPMNRDGVSWLREKMGVKAILSLTERPLPSQWLDGLTYRIVTMRNHKAPSIQQLDESVNFLLDQSKAGNITAAHCAAGKGRTGTVLAAYLCAKYGSTAADAIRQVREKRPGSVERIQEASVVEYKQMLESKKSGSADLGGLGL